MNMDKSFVSIKEIKTPAKISSRIYFMDLIFIFAFSFIMFQFKFLVSPYFEHLYLIICVLWGFILTMPSRFNKGKKNWQTVIFFFIRNQTCYTDISECKKKIRGEKTM